MRLRHIGHVARDLDRAHAVDRRVVEQHRAAERALQPEQVRNSVVLPAPFGPSRHSTSPGASVSAMFDPTRWLR